MFKKHSLRIEHVLNTFPGRGTSTPKHVFDRFQRISGDSLTVQEFVLQDIFLEIRGRHVVGQNMRQCPLPAWAEQRVRELVLGGLCSEARLRPIA